jgi:methionyl-tRNA formyltransferase
MEVHSPLRVVFMGTAEVACASLEALLDSPEIEVRAVVTQPDKPKGRALKLSPSAVKEVAIRRTVPVLQPLKARDPEFIQHLALLSLDLIVVAAYGQILPRAILDLPRLGCINVHMSLLPKYRGASPIQTALLNGESATGVTLMKMDEGLDTGPILTQTILPIFEEDTGSTLHDRLAIAGAKLLAETWKPYAEGRITPRSQDSSLATHCGKIRKEAGRLDWSRPADSLRNQIRAFDPWPGAFSGDSGRTLKIWKAKVVPRLTEALPGTVLETGPGGIVVRCGVDALNILEIQREGGKRLPVSEFLKGHSVPVGSRFE